MIGSQDCNLSQSFCESEIFNSAVNCNQTYDCLNRNDEDPGVCVMIKSNKTLETIKEMQEDYTRYINIRQINILVVNS